MGYMFGCMIQLLGVFFAVLLMANHGFIATVILVLSIFGGLLVGFKLTSDRGNGIKKEVEQKMKMVIPLDEKLEESKVYMAHDYESKIILDDVHKKVMVIENKLSNVAILSSTLSKYDFEANVFPYRDILSIEIYVDGASITKTSRSSQLGGALVGGILAGGVGAIIGGTTGTKTTTENIKKIDLLITVNDIQKPIHAINFYSGDIDPTINSVGTAKTAMAICKEWYSILTHIIKQDDKKIESDTDTHNNIVQKLKELQELKVEGILTEEEFNTQKNKILNNS